MPTLPTLLTTLATLHRQHLEIEYQIADIEREIIAIREDTVKGHRKHAVPAETVELVREAVKVLREAGGPLSLGEIAARLGLGSDETYYRVQKAVEARFVEKLGGGRYRAAYLAPAF